MVHYDVIVLHKLLDTYENSLLSTGDNVRTIHIELRFTKKTMPIYFDETAAAYEHIHIEMESLASKGLVSILWKGGRAGHIIEKVRLNLERLDEAYAYVHREPKTNLEAQNLALFERYGGRDSVCGAFVCYLTERLSGHQSIKEFIQLDRLEETERLLQTICWIEENNRPLYVREFSILHYGDSKAFEQFGSKIASVFRRFKAGCSHMDLSEILAEYQIYYTPNFVYLKGDAMIRIGEEVINLRVLHQGIGISGEDIGKIKFSGGDVKQIITIENLTSFFRWDEPNSLMIYLGGYHNTVRRLLLQELYASLPYINYFHFGDIDAGGFEIYSDLCVRTGIPFSMYHMDLNTLKTYAAYGKSLTRNDRARLERMLASGQWTDQADILEYMLEHDVKLEQECVSCLDK